MQEPSVMPSLTLPPDDPAYLAAVAAQQAASDPEASAWVTANAGAGKTKVLVDRIARLLLLPDASPDRILAITYTKAAAAEMQARLFAQLGDWSIATDADLTKALNRIEGKPAGQPREPAELSRARRLFALALETPGGLKLQTIHGFCTTLLKRFPLEAGLMPGFSILTEAEADALQADAEEAVLADPALQPALSTVWDVASQDHFDTAIRAALQDRARWRRILAGGLEAALARIDRALDVTAADDADAILAAGWAQTDKITLAEASAALPPKGEKQNYTHRLARCLTETDAALAMQTYASALLTYKPDTGWKVLGQPPGVDALKASPAAARLFAPKQNKSVVPTPEQERVLAILDHADRARQRAHSAALLTLAAARERAFAAAKAARGKLDFDDQIARAHRLLTGRQGAAAWVLFKLDQGIDHLLIDEGQDTSPPQWELLRPIVEEFEAGAGARAIARTRFAVGDEKQSIYSFQGADPGRFLAERDAFVTGARASGARIATPTLALSFRTAPPVLAAVDAVLEKLGIDSPRHVANRAGAAGHVSWRGVAPVEKPADLGHWKDPLDRAGRANPGAILAQEIASDLRALLDDGAGVQTQSGLRPVRPEDVMILLRSRSALFFQLFRALKRAGVPVEGADRITLGEEIAVQDLLAIGRFALLPEDDLTLASVLKGPFGGLRDDEADLAPLARPGRRSLWAELLAQQEPALRAVADRLKAVRARAQSLPPYEFYAALLDGRIGPAGETGWALLIGRLGHAAREPVEAFLSRALDADDPPASLEAFLHAVERDTRQIKRELGSGASGVRIMTVHGAKGLEAPIVILPDTTAGPQSDRNGGLYLSPEDGLLLWVASGANHTAASRALRDANKAAREAEDKRLLYVAMTRARDRLWVRGAHRGKAVDGRAESSWHKTIEDALTAAGAVVSGNGAALDLGAPPPPVAADPQSAPEDAVAPAWVGAAAPPEQGVRRAAPSALAPVAGAERVLSPLGRNAATRFRRGEAIHDLLQRLPDLPAAEREAAALRRLAAYPEASPEERAAWASEALAVLEDPAFAAVFGPGSRAEVPLVGGGVGLPDDLVVNGAIDRLLVTEAEVLAIDFKTNRPPPASAQDVAPAYLAQMAAYRAVLRRVFPGRAVRCALVWTDGPRLTELPQSLLDAALRAIAPAPTSPH